MVSQATDTTDAAQTDRTVVEPTARRPSVALDAFLAAVNQDNTTVATLTRTRVCEALADALPEDDIRQTDFNVRYCETTRDSPAGTLVIDHPEVPDAARIVVDSAKPSSVPHAAKHPTLFTAFTTPAAYKGVGAENVGCVAALKSASERMARERQHHTSLRSQAWRTVKHDILG